MNLANRLTVSRLIMVPFFVAAFYLIPGDRKIVAGLIFVAASLTDLFDGKIARKRNIITDFGKIMDTIADKVLVLCAILLLVEANRISAIIALIILSREFLISGLRISAASKGKVLQAGFSGKTKTVIQMTALSMYLFLNPFVKTGIEYYLSITAEGLLYLSVLMSLISAYRYIYDNRALFYEK